MRWSVFKTVFGACFGWAGSILIKTPMSVTKNPGPTATSSDQKWSELKAGDWVLIRSADEIEATLSEDGSTDGLSFMPEMAACCGKRFRIGRAGTTVCINSVSYTHLTLPTILLV